MRGEFGEPGDNRSPDGDRDQQDQGRPEFGSRVTVLESADDHFGDEHRLGNDQRRPGRAQPHDRHEEEASGAGVPQQTWIDWFHVKHTSVHPACFT